MGCTNLGGGVLGAGGTARRRHPGTPALSPDSGPHPPTPSTPHHGAPPSASPRHPTMGPLLPHGPAERERGAPVRQIRVAIPLAGFNLSGGVKSLVGVANALVERGHKVRFLVPDFAATP